MKQKQHYLLVLDFDKLGIPAYPSPEDTAITMSALVKYDKS